MSLSTTRVPRRAASDNNWKRPPGHRSYAEPLKPVNTPASSIEIRAWLRHQAHCTPTERERELFQKSSLNFNQAIDLPRTKPNALAWLRDHFEYRKPKNALSTITATAGKELISTDTIVTQLEVSLMTNSVMRQVAQTITLSRRPTDDKFLWPTAGPPDPSVIVAEGQSVDANSSDPTVGQVPIQVYKFVVPTIVCSNELLEDSQLDFSLILADLLGEAHAEGSNDKFTNGSGSGEPFGLVTQSTLGVTAAGPTDVTTEELVALRESVAPAYRRSGAWMMADSSLSYIRGMDDAKSGYLFQQGRDGARDSLLGDVIFVNDDMPAMATAIRKSLNGFGRLGNPPRRGQLLFAWCQPGQALAGGTITRCKARFDS